jgi:hypothetical protein
MAAVKRQPRRRDPSTGESLVIWLIVAVVLLAGIEWEFERVTQAIAWRKALQEQAAASHECEQHHEECPNGQR